MQEERTNVPKIRFKGYAEDWEQCKLGELVKITSGWAPSYFEEEDSEGDLFIKVDDLNYSTRVQNDSKMKVIENRKYKKMSKGSVIFPKRGAAIMTNKIRVLGKNAYMDTNMMALEAIKINSEFLYTFIDRTGLFKIADTSTIPQINNKHIEPYQILLPSPKEQAKIGLFFKQLDNTIALHQRGLDLLKQTKKSYLQKMFPKKGEDKPEIRFAGFTDAWEQRKLGEMVKQFSIKSKKEDEYTVLSSTNSGMEIRDGRVSGTSNLGYKIVEDGDLVLSPQNLWLGNININDIGKGLVSPSYKTFKFTNINSAFLKPQLHTSKMLEEYKNSSTQGASIVRRNLELDSFYQIPMLVPTTEEQSKLGVFFESMDNTITLHQRELDSLKEMKKSLLQQMFV